MLRGYRNVFVALAGLALIGAGPKQQQQSVNGQGNADTQHAAETIATAIRDTIKPPEQDAGCQDRSDKRDSDLCAQWKAADAANSAAIYSFWAVIISAFATGLVVWTFQETRQNSRRELRAYLFVDSITLGVADKGPNKGFPGGIIVIKNFGQTPAYRVLHYGVIDLVESSAPLLSQIPETLGNVSASAIPPGANITGVRGIGRKLTFAEIRRVRKGELTFVARGRIEYNDAFERKRWTTYHYFYSGIWPPLPQMLMSIANDGNENDQSHSRPAWYQRWLRKK